ncbi:MAG TPA: hypothetical protein VJQ56_13345 [Blastocatellia bacterium]|nr:hypothetical protein [Blastocatellia bacterium]
MKTPPISFDSIPASALSVSTLHICLKCAFDLFTKQLKLAPRTAYFELKKHVPEESDFTGASTVRPHFLLEEGQTHCPYCNASKRWFAAFRAVRVDAHPSFEKERKKLWGALKKEKEGFTLWHPDKTPMQIFSEWLERLNRSLDFENDSWLIGAAIEYIKRASPSARWPEIVASGIRRVQLSRQVEGEWNYENGWLYVPPVLYGDALMVQHLISRSHQHGGRTFEGRLTLAELVGRLRRMGYFEAKGIDSRDPYEAFEQAIASITESGPQAIHYAVDRTDYLAKLKAVYEKKRDK